MELNKKFKLNSSKKMEKKKVLIISNLIMKSKFFVVVEFERGIIKKLEEKPIFFFLAKVISITFLVLTYQPNE